jgi:hypothetical protein
MSLGWKDIHNIDALCKWKTLVTVGAQNDDAFKEILADIDSIRKLRNRVIHDNRGISVDEAQRALTTAIIFLNYIGFKKY